MKFEAYHEGPAEKLMPARWSQLITHKQDDAAKEAGVRWDLEGDNLFQHPFMLPFRTWKGDNNLDFIRFPRRTAMYWEAKPTTRGMVLVHYDDEQGRPAVFDLLSPDDKEKPGHVLLFTTALDRREPAWHNYMENSFYVGLIWLSTRYLVGEAEELDFNFIVGRGTPVVRLPLSPRFPAYTLRGPEITATLTVEEGQNFLRLPQATQPGNYALEGSSASGNVAGFSVNVPAEESNLTRVPQVEIENLLGAGAVVPLDRRLPLRDSLQGHWSEPIDLFPFLMLALLLFLAVENLLANKFYKTESQAA